MFHKVATTFCVGFRQATVSNRIQLSQIPIRTFSGLAGRHQRPVLQAQTLQSSSQRQIHPAVLLIGKQVAKFIAILTGRAFRKWWKDLPADKRQHFLGKIRKHRKGIMISSAGLVGATSVFYYTHLEETPLTKRVRFMAFNERDMKTITQVSSELEYELVKENLYPSSHQYVRRVRKVAERILEANKDIEQIFSKEWSVSVVNSPHVNALVGPGGQILVFAGMLGMCENDDQLGCVLAHEISHAILNHGAEMLSYTNLLDTIFIVVLAAIWALMPTDLISAAMHWFFNRLCDVTLQLPYSRLLETEADVVGLELAAKACFDVRESSAFWSKMTLMRELQGEQTLPEFLSTHPDNEKRCETLDEMMDDAIRRRVECNCPRLPKRDPRDSREAYKHQIHAAKKWRESLEKEGVLLIRVPQR